MNLRDQEPDESWRWAVGFCLVGVAAILGAMRMPDVLAAAGVHTGIPGVEDSARTPVAPLTQFLKLALATLIGLLVTAVHKRYHRDRPLPRSLQQAQVLLCIAGALVMVIIGNSTAIAFGVAGAAGIVRFRTPVEDPKDTTILFLLVALGMASGVGLMEVAAGGAVFLCAVIALLDKIGESAGRSLVLTVVATTKDFPNEHVQRILGSTVDYYEVREMIRGNEATVRYSVMLAATTKLSWINQQLMENGEAGLKAVSWQEAGKKNA